MLLRRAVISALVLVTLSLVGLSGNSAALTGERTETAYNNGNLVRLHILANSDLAADQAIKIKVRDAMIKRTRTLFLKARNADEALAIVRRERRSLAALAASVARSEGARYGARVEVGTFSFPTRTYAFGVLPAGRYRAVRILLGRGQGHNWWCVLFPPLCFLSPQGAVQTAQAKESVHVRVLFLERLLHAGGQRLDRFWQGWVKFWRLPMKKTA